MLLVGQASCTVLVPAGVKLKVSVWMLRQLLSSIPARLRKKPNKSGGNVVIRESERSLPTGRGKWRNSLSLSLPGYVFFLFFIPKCHIHPQVSWPASLRPPLIRTLMILCLPF